MSGRNGNEVGQPSSRALIDVIKTADPKAPVILDNEDDDGCGIGWRGIADFIRITVTSTRRVWSIPYHSFIADQGELQGELTKRLSFVRGGEVCWLSITGSAEEPAFVDHIIMAMQQRTRKTLRADKKRILDINIVLAPQNYDPFEERDERAKK